MLLLPLTHTVHDEDRYLQQVEGALQGQLPPGKLLPLADDELVDHRPIKDI
jgi:hypothetical protein